MAFPIKALTLDNLPPLAKYVKVSVVKYAVILSTTLDTYVHLNTKKRNLSVMTIAQDFFMTFLVK